MIPPLSILCPVHSYANLGGSLTIQAIVVAINFKEETIHVYQPVISESYVCNRTDNDHIHEPDNPVHSGLCQNP